MELSASSYQGEDRMTVSCPPETFDDREPIKQRTNGYMSQNGSQIHEYQNNPLLEQQPHKSSQIHEYQNNPVINITRQSSQFHEYQNEPDVQKARSSSQIHEYQNNPQIHEYQNNPITQRSQIHEYQNFEIQRPEKPGETSSRHGSRRSSCCSADDERDDDLVVRVERVSFREDVEEVDEKENQPATDRYGFFLDPKTRILPETQIDPAKLRSREKKWIQMLDNWRYFMDEKFEVVRNRCRKGIPPSLRGRAWKYLTGATYQMEVSANRFVFDYCLKQPGDPKWNDDIQKDLNRQFPEHEMFSRLGKYGDAGKGDLFNLLKAWTILHPEEGYCQGQAPIAAVLLMHMPVRDAFYCFVQICHKYLPGYYSAGLEAVQIDGDVLNKLLKDKSKLTYRLFKKNNIEPVLYMVEWFMCVYCRTLPWPTVLRVWDMFLCEGVKVLFKVALVLLKYGLGTPTQVKENPDLHAIVTRLRKLPPQIMTEEFIVQKVCEMVLNDSEMERMHHTALKLRAMRFS